MIILSLHQRYSQHQPSHVRPVNAETFDPTSDVVPGLSGARGTIRRLLFCVLENLGSWEFNQHSRALEEMFGQGVKSHLPKESRSGNTGAESTRESTSIGASTKRDASLGVEAILTDRELHKNAICTNCV